VKATEILMQEHRLIGKVLDYLEEAAGRLEDGEEIDPDFFIDSAEFIAGFADGRHHRKEEDILFVAMTAKDMPADAGPVAVMLHEHEQGRRFTAGFRAAAELMKTGESSAVTDVVRNVFDYVNLLREHIVKEENVLFPMAEQIIDGGTMQRVARDFEKIVMQDRENGTLAEYEALVEKLDSWLHTN
jgi:hemerythrin-like domain-containing protein